MQGMPTQEAFEADVEMPLSHLLDHLQERGRKQDFKLYLAQKGIAEVLPGLEQQVGPVPFPIANSRLQKSSIWLGPAGELRLQCYCQEVAAEAQHLRDDLDHCLGSGSLDEGG